MAAMAHETRCHYGEVPRELGGLSVEPGFRIIADGQFLLRCESGFGYHYLPGAGITIERPDPANCAGADPDEEGLWLNGSVYAAVACLNGLYPVHASAVASDGQVYAFDDECTHQQCSLADGELEGQTVTCPCHFGVFDITTGAVISGPVKEPVRTYPARLVDDTLELEVDE